MTQPDQRTRSPPPQPLQFDTHSLTTNATPQHLCYRHRPDLTRNRPPDPFNFQDVQRVSQYYINFS